MNVRGEPISLQLSVGVCVKLADATMEKMCHNLYNVRIAPLDPTSISYVVTEELGLRSVRDQAKHFLAPDEQAYLVAVFVCLMASLPMHSQFSTREGGKATPTAACSALTTYLLCLISFLCL